MVTLPLLTQAGTSGAYAKLAQHSLSPAVRGSPAGLECTVVRGKHVGHTSEAASTQTGDKCLCKTVLLSATMEQV